jgi:hypothetical protein
MSASAPPVTFMLQRIGPDKAAEAKNHFIADLRARFGDGPVKLACEAHYGVARR